jgi:hypothetical protein
LKRSRTPVNAERKRLFRETARDILLNAKVKRRFGEAVDTAGAVARAMQQAYRMGFDDAVNQVTGSAPTAAVSTASVPTETSADALEWSTIPPRTRATFWSICLAALGREPQTGRSSHLTMILKPGGAVAWQLVVSPRQPYEKTVGDGTISTLLRLGLLEHATTEEPRVILTDYGIRTWNRFLERGGQWSEDLIETL